MILVVNLPNNQEGEKNQGMVMISVLEENDKTLVSMFTSRIYFWPGPQDNMLRKRRSTAEFAESRKQTFKGNFLTTLKALAEK